MTPERAYELSRFQRPGVRLIVGPTEAREEPVPPLWWWHLSKLPGPCSWYERELRQRLGFVPHLLALTAGLFIERVTGTPLSDQQWRFLSDATAEERRQALLAAYRPATPTGGSA